MSREKPFMKTKIQLVVRVRCKERPCAKSNCSLCFRKGGQAPGELFLFPCPSVLRWKAQTVSIDCFAGTFTVYISNHQTKGWGLLSVQ